MEAFATVIVLLSSLVFVFGVVNIIYPLKALKIRKRLIGVFIVLGSLAGCMGGGIMGAASQPGGLQGAMEKAEQERLAAEAARGAEKAKSSPPQVVASPKAAPRPAGLTQGELNAMWGR